MTKKGLNVNYPEYQPVVEATRGNIVESVHFGAVAIVDAYGRMIASHGDADTVSFLRSSSKPIQVLPLVEQGGADIYQLSDKEIAVMCASHAGTPDHVQTVESIQAKINITYEDLLCGSHFPHDDAASLEMHMKGESPTENHNNCSGKHTGMLALCLLNSQSTEDYINPAHPTQQMILKTFADMCGLKTAQIESGVDGCSAPVFAVPMKSAAHSFARLCDPQGLTEQRANACRRITRAMISHPEMVAGPGRFDTQLMRAARGKVVSKSGAEGYLLVGVMPGVLDPKNPGLGIAIKIADGDPSGRARSITALEILNEMCILTEEELEELSDFNSRPICNWRGIEVGELRSTLKLDFPGFPAGMPLLPK